MYIYTYYILLNTHIYTYTHTQYTYPMAMTSAELRSVTKLFANVFKIGSNISGGISS